MKSELKIFKSIEEAMEFCDHLEAATYGRLFYRPAMKDFNRYYLVKKDRRTGSLRTMSEMKWSALTKKYFA